MAQAYIAMAPAADAYIDLVEPLWVIPRLCEHAAIPSGESPGPS